MNPMDHAFAEAQKAAARGEVPVGAVISDAAGNIIAAAGNQVEAGQNPAGHAEMLALREAGTRLGQKFLTGCTITVTLEPCAMCAGAISAYRVAKLVFAAYDPKSGAVEHGPKLFTQPTTHHRPEIISGVREREANALLKDFFSKLREL